MQAPSAQRIASILRSEEPWVAPPTSLDLAHSLATKQRQLVNPSLSTSGRLTVPAASTLVQIPLAGTAEAKISQLAERVSVLVASLQRRCDEDKEELEQHMDKMDARLEARLSSMEARVLSSEDGSRGQMDSALLLREARGLIGTALSEAQSVFRAELAELRAEQHESLRQLEELAGSSHQSVLRVEKLERAALAQERCLRRMEETVEAFASQNVGMENPPWFSQLEGALLSLEQRLSEQQMTIEVQLARLQVDCDGLRRRAEILGGLREEVLQAVQEKVDAVAPLSGRAELRPERMPAAAECTLARRIDDMEARTAAQRVKIEAHEVRFGTFSERLEAACQEAVAQARVVAHQRREEILMEVDCQLRVLRQRMDSITELSDELMFQQATGQCGARASSAGVRKEFDASEVRGKLPSLAEEASR